MSNLSGKKRHRYREERKGTGATGALMGGSGPQDNQKIFQGKIGENTFRLKQSDKNFRG
jgi:hypothetical protein